MYSIDQDLGKIAGEVIGIIKSQGMFKNSRYGITDAVYEIIGRYLEKGDKINCDDPKKWIVTGTQRLLISQHRKDKSHHSYLKHEQHRNEFYEDPFHKFEAMDDCLMKKLLKSNIHRLPTRCRQVVEAWLDGASDEEIAKTFGIQKSTVASHKSHAKEIIIKHLRDSAGSRKP